MVAARAVMDAALVLLVAGMPGIKIKTEEGWVRYIDTIKNTGAEGPVNQYFSTSLKYGVQTATMIPDPKKKDNNLAWVALTHAQGKSVVEMYGGKGAKVMP